MPCPSLKYVSASSCCWRVNSLKPISKSFQFVSQWTASLQLPVLPSYPSFNQSNRWLAGVGSLAIMWWPLLWATVLQIYGYAIFFHLLNTTYSVLWNVPSSSDYLQFLPRLHLRYHSFRDSESGLLSSSPPFLHLPNEYLYLFISLSISSPLCCLVKDRNCHIHILNSNT